MLNSPKFRRHPTAAFGRKLTAMTDRLCPNAAAHERPLSANSGPLSRVSSPSLKLGGVYKSRVIQSQRFAVGDEATSRGTTGIVPL